MHKTTQLLLLTFPSAPLKFYQPGNISNDVRFLSASLMMRCRLLLLTSLFLMSFAMPLTGQETKGPENETWLKEFKRTWKADDDNGSFISSGPKSPEAEGLIAFQEKFYDFATIKLREAWKNNRKNVHVAIGLMFSQLNSIKKPPSAASAAEMVNEFAEFTKEFPDNAQLQVGYGVALAYAGKYSAAQHAIDRGEALGANVEQMVGWQVLKKIKSKADKQTAQQTIDDGIYRSALVILGLAAGLLIWIGIMFLAGMTLAVSIPRTPQISHAAEALQSRRDIWLERFYVVALILSLMVFYLSVPFIVAGIIAVSLILFGLLFALRVLNLGILYRGLWAVWHMLRLVFFGSRSEIIGIEVKGEQHPKLFEELRSVANRLDTAVVDRVYLVPGTEVSVKQDGSGPFGLLGRQHRDLHLGIALLPWLTINELRAILAHEYAHFGHNDPFFKRFISQVSASLANSLAVLQAAAGGLNFINPFYGLYSLYLRAYALLSAGYFRSREFLADRRAVLTYGRQSFVSGLTKVYQEGELFELFAFHNTKRLLAEGNAFKNVFDSYREYREQPEAAEIRANLLEHAKQRKLSWFDSHPTYCERVVAAESFPITLECTESGSALDLVSNFEEVEESLTRLLTTQVVQQMEARVANCPACGKRVEFGSTICPHCNYQI